jgi:hypothetical protein
MLLLELLGIVIVFTFLGVRLTIWLERRQDMQRIVVIKSDKGFWTGYNWSPEYPEANTYPTHTSAKRDAYNLAKKGTAVKVYKDYGLESEFIIAAYDAQND